jgi:hypothetical protein
VARAESIVAEGEGAMVGSDPFHVLHSSNLLDIIQIVDHPFSLHAAGWKIPFPRSVGDDENANLGSAASAWLGPSLLGSGRRYGTSSSRLSE